MRIGTAAGTPRCDAAPPLLRSLNDTSFARKVRVA
jgi:hypothetical protein